MVASARMYSSCGTVLIRAATRGDWWAAGCRAEKDSIDRLAGIEGATVGSCMHACFCTYLESTLPLHIGGNHHGPGFNIGVAFIRHSLRGRHVPAGARGRG